jgi:outer membrane protein
MRVAVTLAIVALAATSAAAQGPVVRLTLEDAIARGIEASQRLAEMRARLEAAEASEAARRAAEQPSVALQGGYTRTNHVDEFVIAQPGLPLRVLYPDIPDNFRTRLDLQWPIYTGGRGDALVRAARAENNAARDDVEAARADLRLEIARAFWALVTADDTAAVLAASLKSVAAHVRDLTVRLEQGLIPPNDLLSAQAQQSRQRMLAIEAQNTRAVAEADVKRLLDLDGDARIEPAVALQAPHAQDVTADRLAADALGRRPERRALEQRIEAARARVDATASLWRPQLAVTAGYDYARPNPRIFPRTGEWEDSWDVSVNATWPLWDGGRRAAERAEAVAAARAAETRGREFDRAVVFEVRQRWLEVDSSRAAIAAAEDGVRAAVEARRVVGERYAAGVATSTDVLDAEIAVLQAQLDRTRAIANARLAEARLRRAVGSE